MIVSLLKRLELEKSRRQGSEEGNGTPSSQLDASVDRGSGNSVMRERATRTESKEAKAAKAADDPFLQWKVQLHQQLVQALFEEEDGNDGGLEATIRRVVEQSGLPLAKHERERMITELRAETDGFGPIDSLLKDEQISEVMVNGASQVYVERGGKLELTPVKFLNDAHVMRVIEKIVAPLGRRIDESSPMVDARLPDGSRVNAIIPPLAVRGPSVTIRKFAKDPFQVDDLVGFGTFTPDMARFLEACVAARLNVVVSGGTGSGKSTTLNVLSSFIPDGERVVTIEDAAELQLRQEHVVTLETRPPNVEGKGAVTMRDLVKNSLRM